MVGPVSSRPRRFRFAKSALVTAASCGIESSAGFRLRLADGRFALAAFLRLSA